MHLLPTYSRRAFLRQASLATFGTLALPSALLARPYRPEAAPVRIRGTVRAPQGLPGVRVTDGVSVVQTDQDGAFELVSAVGRPFVYLSMPAGYAIPRNAAGTARTYAPIVADARQEMAVDFTLTPSPLPDVAHRFFVLADTQMQHDADFARFAAEFVPDFSAYVGLQDASPMFGVGCGDIMWDDLTRYGAYEAGVGAAGIPFFQVVGNHDIDFEARSDWRTTSAFEAHFGPTYYSFDRGEVHYVVLDDVFWHGKGYIGYLDETQLAWLEQDLSYLEPGRTVVVFLHIPALSTRYKRAGEGSPPPNVSVTNREVLYDLLAPFQAHLISGHTHEKEHVYAGGLHEHIAGAVCGAWWTGDICADGTPNGYDVFEVDGSSLRWHYKATGHDAGHQVRVYRHGSDPLAPDEIVANVWDWQPQWDIVWYEDGVRRGPMARRMGYDPLAVGLYAGAEQPAHRGWVEPYPTNHLFYAPASRTASTILVEATDRFGRVYTATLEPAP